MYGAADNPEIWPWKLIESYDLGYSEGCIVDRVCAWRSRASIDDLRQALRCAERLLDAAPRLSTLRGNIAETGITMSVTDFIEDNRITGLDAEVLIGVCTWSMLGEAAHLQKTQRAILELIHQERMRGQG